MNIKFFIFNT